MGEFAEGCRSLGIPLFLLPPGSPRLKGHVERRLRTLRGKFSPLPFPRGLAHLQAELDAHLEHYNRPRPLWPWEGWRP